MDLSAITTLISSVGFPIFVSLVLFYYIYKMQEKSNDTIDKLSETINNNTIVIQSLSEHIRDVTCKLGADSNE